MSDLDPLVILGGAFDPVHYGHLRAAFEVRELLQPCEVRLIPSAQPPHRAPHVASNAVRMQMLDAAVAAVHWCRADDRELRRPETSWTAVTLEGLRADYGDRSLCIILGMDAFLGLPGWHRWEEICDLAHLIVVHRPGWSPPAEGQLGALISQRITVDPEDLRALPAGRILVQEVTQLEISSSRIRELVAAGRQPLYLLPDAVLEIIQNTGCYAAGADEN